MTRYGETRRSLQEEKLAPKKQLGQNFLVHKATAEAVARCGNIDSTDIIIEVGVGLGALTQPIAEQAAQVIGLEVDRGIVRLHKEKQDLPDNVTLLHQDILTADFDELLRLSEGRRLKIMANLPYSISNPFLFKLIEHQEKMDWATIMLQKEVADRLTAKPGTKQYGIPTLLLKSCATVKPLLTLKPAEFHPRPKVDSVVVRIQFQSGDQRDESYDRLLLQKIVRAAFSQRRKTLLNTLSSGDFFRSRAGGDKKLEKQLTRGAILKADIPPTIRAEVLELEQFIELTHTFSSTMDSPD